MRKLSLFFLALAALFLPLHTARAASDTDWIITHFASDITVKPEGTVAITETIDVNFAIPKHGIYRDIPFAYTGGEEKIYATIDFVSATLDGALVQNKLSKSRGQVRFQLGDPDVTITGVHRYVISYIATGILRGFPTYDELYWNVTGSNWDVTIVSAEAVVHLPQAGISQSSCYQGIQSSTAICTVGAALVSTDATFTSTSSIAAGEGMTVAVGYTKGMVPLLTVANPLTQVVVLSSIAGLLLLFIGLKVRKHVITKYNLSPLSSRTTSIAPEYEAPDKLRPAQLGTILDSSADTVDISATIVDLAVRGFLTITEVPQSFGRKTYTFTSTGANQAKLLPYEQQLLTDLFAAGPTVELDDIKESFYLSVQTAQKTLYSDLVERNYFAGNPEFARGILIVIMVLWILLAIGGLSFNRMFPVMPGIAVASAILAFVSLRDLLTLRNMTAEGQQAHRKTLGYKLFLSETEKYRQPFFEKENYFMTVLPYAMVFGVTKKLAQAFEKMGYVPAQPSWYLGAAFVSYSDMLNSIESLGSATNQSFTPPSSSGSGGGGSSGGGFGGGGGGSW